MAWNRISNTRQQSIVIFLTPAILFSLILFFLYPTYHSADDNYFLYEMSGANGNGATNLLQYDYGMHPYLIYPVKFLFEISPGVNWYSLLLYSLHFVSWLVISRVVLGRLPLFGGLLLIAVLFSVFGAQFLLRVTYTNTSAVTAIAGLIHLMSSVSFKVNFTKFDGFLSAGLLILAGLIRLHIIIPFAALSLILFAVYPLRRFLSVVWIFCIVIAVLFVLNVLHKSYYRNHISDWDKKDNYRAAVLSFDNHNKTADTSSFSEKELLQNKWLQNGILVDTQFLTSSDIRRIVAKKKGPRKLATLKPEIYWLLVNSRIMIGTAAAILFFGMVFLKNGKFKNLLAVAQGFLLMASYWLLLVYAKLPYYFIPLTLFFYSLCCLFWFAGSVPKRNKFVNALVVVLGLICVTWAAIRLYKENKKNLAGHKDFVNAWQEIRANSDKLYVAPYFSIPFDDIGVFESPYKYPLPNVIFKNSFMNHTHKPAFSRFGIKSSSDLFTNSRVRFLGKTVPLIQQYYPFQTGKSLTLMLPPEKYKHLSVTHLTSAQSRN